ncbi:hypothetical protein HY992_00465 [Candidatus Micrarchaeota archaeon]|nr:hypothetical protein [Candidatus Micrarchaeota archaeon]
MGRKRGQAAIESATPTARVLRGQAAMEYVITYGWALALLVVALTVLYSLGILNPARYLPQECSFSPSVNCEYYRIERVSGTQYNLKAGFTNGLGFKIKLKELAVASDGTLGTAGGFGWQKGLNLYSFSSTEIINDGEQFNLTASFTPVSGPSVGSLERIRATLTYWNCDAVDCNDAGAPTHVVSGRINTNVEPMS